MAATRTFYEILNVSPDAEIVVIDAAYRALMKKYHPDQGGGAADGPSAAEINRAYAALRDPERRADYDHKEWVRQRDIQLAAYQIPPPPRRSNFFGWGGWLVAFVLAGMIALMASKGNMTQLSEAEQARAAALAAPDFRSQPSAPPQGPVSAAEEKEIRAAAFAPRPEPEPEKAAPSPPAETPPAPAHAEPAPVAAPLAEPVPPPAPTHHRLATARRRTAAHPSKAPRKDKDFLERQGYIY